METPSEARGKLQDTELKKPAQGTSTIEDNTACLDCLKDERESDSSSQKELDKSNTEDQQPDSISPKDLNEETSQDRQPDISQRLLDEHKTQSQQQDISSQEKLDEESIQDPQSEPCSHKQEDSRQDENDPRDPQQDISDQNRSENKSIQDPQSEPCSHKQEDSPEDKNDPRDPQQDSDQNRSDNKSIQDPQSEPCSHKQEDSPEDKNDPRDPQQDISDQNRSDNKSIQDPQSEPCSHKQEDSPEDKNDPRDPQQDSDQNRSDNKSIQDPQSEPCSHKDFDQSTLVDSQSKCLSLSQRDKNSTRGGQASSRSEPSGTYRRRDTRLVSRERWKDLIWILMSTFFGGIVFGGLATISYSFTIRYFTPPVPVYNIAPSWNTCPSNPQPVPPLQDDFSSSTETRIQEKMDKRESILKAYLEEKVQRLMVNVKNDVSMSVQDKMKVLKEDLNTSTQNYIKEFVGNLEVRLNKSIENRLQEIILEQNKMFNKTMEKIEDDFHQHKQVTDAAIARTERRFQSRSRSILMGVLSTVDHLRTDLLGKFMAVDVKQELVYRVIEGMNFMRANSWGMLFFFMGLMEAALYIYVCVLLKSPGQTNPNGHLSAQRR